MMHLREPPLDTDSVNTLMHDIMCSRDAARSVGDISSDQREGRISGRGHHEADADDDDSLADAGGVDKK